MKINFLDLIVIIIYLIALLAIGLNKYKSKPNNLSQYILSGRKLSLPGLIITLVATWYGGILGQGENTYNEGIQTWVIFGLPYYIFAILYAFIFPKRIKKLKTFSISDHFYQRFGAMPGIISAIFILIIANPAPYILSLGILTSYITGISFQISILLCTIISFSYLWYGGFNAVVKTDYLQFCLMFLGFALLLFFSINHTNFYSMVNQLPTSFITLTDVSSIQYIAVWFFIALWTFVDPGFYQRVAAAKNSETAKKGILISVFLWFIFDILTLSTGLYAKALLPAGDPLLAYPQLGLMVLPPVIAGLFLTGLLATIMSTIDSLGFISGLTFGYDILWRIESKDLTSETNKTPKEYIRKGLIVSGFISLALVFSVPSVVKLWYTIGSILIPGLLLPFLLSFSDLKINISFSMIFPVIVSSVWFLFGHLTGNYPLHLEPFYPGIVTSFCFITISILNAKRN